MSKQKERMTVILAAGQSRRFSAAGYPLPKPRLPMPDGRCLLEWQVERLYADDLLFVGHKSHQRIMMPKILGMLLQPHMPETFRHKFIHDYTLGPLATTWEIRGWMEQREEVLIIYCDILPHDDFIKDFLDEARDYQAAVVGFESRATRFTKVPNTELACGGIFYFKDGSRLVHNMRRHPRGEANGLPDMVYKHDEWGYVYTEQNVGFVDLGTPEEYLYWMGTMGTPVDKETWTIRKTT